MKCFKRIAAWLLVLALAFGGVFFTAPDRNAYAKETALGTVMVFIENTTLSEADGAPWT